MQLIVPDYVSDFLISDFVRGSATVVERSKSSTLLRSRMRSAVQTLAKSDIFSTLFNFHISTQTRKDTPARRDEKKRAREDDTGSV